MSPVRFQVRYRPVATHTLNTTAPASAAAAAAVAEYPGSSRRLKVDLSPFPEGRVMSRVSSAWSAATKVAVQISLDEVTWIYLAGTANGSAPTANEYVSGAALATLVSGWNTIPAAYRTEVFVRGVTLDGDAATTGAAGNLALQTR